MAKYIFPAVFLKIEEGYYIEFPDLENCFSQGKDMIDSIEMAEDALNLMLIDMEDRKQSIPKPTDIHLIELNDNAVISLVKADTVQYRKENSNRSVKKTLTIPSWLNEAAEKQSVNFSQVLQDALIKQMGIQ